MKDVVYFHSNCMDGFAAAWVHNRFTSNKPDSRENLYIPVAAGSEFDLSVLEEKCQVYILDVAPKAKELVEILKKDNVLHVTIIDHHKTSKELMKELEDITNETSKGLVDFTFIHDMDKSGCVLAQNFFFGSNTEVKALSYIQDRDIWTWKLKNSKEINEYLFTSLKLPNPNSSQDKILNEFSTFTGLVNFLHLHEEKAFLEGKRILEVTDECIKKLSNCASTGKFVLSDGREYKVWYTSTRLYRSEVGSLLLSRKINGEDPAFSVCWHYDIESKNFWLSFRSDNRKVDVSEIAKFYGGGGHRNAAGATLTIEQFQNSLKPL